MTYPQHLPLEGFTVAVTAARRREELEALLIRRGARVVSAPAIRLVPLADDTELLEATRSCIAQPVDVVVATTGIGFRGWVEAADGWALGAELLGVLASAEVLCRGPKARGAVRAAGLVDAWSPESESSNEVLEHLLARDLTGVRIAVQLHGEPLPDFVEALRCAGAEVVEVPVYRWTAPADEAPLRRLVASIVDGDIDVVTFTSAPAALSVLATAAELGVQDAVRDLLRTRVLSVCVGPVTAAPLERLGITTVQPERARLGALVRETVEQAPRRLARRLTVAGHRLEIRGHAVVLDDAVIALPKGSLALLRCLAAEPGRVRSRADLVATLPGTPDEHAVEMAVTRLRTSLGDPRVVQTVVKRGYRLAYEVEAEVDGGCLDDDLPDLDLSGMSVRPTAERAP